MSCIYVCIVSPLMYTTYNTYISEGYCVDNMMPTYYVYILCISMYIYIIYVYLYSYNYMCVCVCVCRRENPIVVKIYDCCKILLDIFYYFDLLMRGSVFVFIILLLPS